jgi:FkbM family methyltransferase
LGLFGEFSESEVVMFRTLIKPTDIVVDAGANIGAHTVALASLVPDGGVVAFEPIRFHYHMLCGNLALNALTNVLPYYAALGKEQGFIVVPPVDFTHEDTFGGMALGSYAKGNRVPLLRLDDVLPKVDFIKADVEGMEQQVLEGASRLITECQPVLYVENNPGPQQQTLINYMHSLHYDLWWHYAPLFNPANYRGVEDQTMYRDEHDTPLVSFNILGLPHHEDHQVDGLVRIERAA